MILTMHASQTAVVRGALMKSLAEVKGLTAKLPRIRARAARKYYGTRCFAPYKRRQDPGDDGHSPERSFPYPYLGHDHVEVMEWFLHQVCCRNFQKKVGMLLLADLGGTRDN